jgi:hypothetical protein
MEEKSKMDFAYITGRREFLVIWLAILAKKGK